jgi:hypothetical protein
MIESLSAIYKTSLRLKFTVCSFGLSVTSHQPVVLFLSEQISHQQPANSTFPSQQISTSHQPNEQAVNCKLKALFFKFKG